MQRVKSVFAGEVPTKKPCKRKMRLKPKLKNERTNDILTKATVTKQTKILVEHKNMEIFIIFFFCHTHKSSARLITVSKESSCSFTAPKMLVTRNAAKSGRLLSAIFTSHKKCHLLQTKAKEAGTEMVSIASDILVHIYEKYDLAKTINLNSESCFIIHIG